MAQVYFRDSGLLTDEGRTEEEFRNEADFNPAIHDIADTGQTFNINRVPKRQVWFYIKDLDQFYESKDGTHAFWAAAAAQFSNGRWKQIEDILEESGSVKKALNELKHAKIIEKATKQQGRSLITVDELNELKKIFK